FRHRKRPSSNQNLRSSKKAFFINSTVVTRKYKTGLRQFGIASAGTRLIRVSIVRFDLLTIYANIGVMCHFLLRKEGIIKRDFDGGMSVVSADLEEFLIQLIMFL